MEPALDLEVARDPGELHTLSADLAAVSVVDLLQLLERTRRTGSAVLASDRGVATIQLKEGRIVAASAPASKPFNALLFEASGISDEPRDGDLGRLLVEHNAVDWTVLEQATRVQIRDAIGEMVGWTEGHFFFDSSDCAAECEVVEMKTGEVLIDAILGRDTEIADIEYADHGR